MKWQPIKTAPKDGTVVVGALIVDDQVWRVHEMRHNGLAWYTFSGDSLPAMTHWVPMPTYDDRAVAVDAPTLDAVSSLNDEIQTWVNDHATEVPQHLEVLLAQLDILLNGP